MLDMPQFRWCHEAVALLRSAIDNNLTASETASLIGKCFSKAPSRNAVIGKAFRLGLSFGESHGKRSGASAVGQGGRRGFPWTPRAVETFLELVALGHTSDEIIVRMGEVFHAAPRLSVTAVQQRASILGVSIGGGKKHRAGSPSLIPAPMAAAPSRPAQDNGREVGSSPDIPPATPFMDGGVTLLDLEIGMCRWISGDPRDYATTRYCGAEARAGHSYCVSHFALAYVPAKDRKRTQAQEEADDRRRQSAMRHWASGLRASGRSARL